jgi:uracil-DNA glycosylase family 4
MTGLGSDREPSPDCDRCPRLASFRNAERLRHPDWFNAPVPSFGAARARLLIVGLAPGLKGANRTGRPFTGDYAGMLLYETLIKFGFATGTYGESPDDGLALPEARITNAVRCVPPENKPLPVEIAACRPFFRAELESSDRLSAILALGQIAHGQVLSALGLVQSRYQFGHGAIHRLPADLILADSYHCSRYNTNTGRLTAGMFEAVVATLATLLAS